MRKRIAKALEILGLPTMVTRKEVRDRYIQLMKSRHPDIVGADDTEAGEIIRAYELLKEYMDNFRFRFDAEEISRQYPDENHRSRFRF